MNLTFLEIVLWIGGLAAELLLLLSLSIRRRWKSFPFLTIYILYRSAYTIVAMATHRRRMELGAAVFWIDEGADSLLQIGILIDIARGTFGRLSALRRPIQSYLFKLCAVSLLLSAALGLSVASSGLRGRLLWDMRIEIMTSLIVCSLIWIFLASARRFGFHPNRYVLAVSRVFSAWAVLAMLADVSSFMSGLARVEAILDNVSGFIWVFVLSYLALIFLRSQHSSADRVIAIDS